MRVLHLIVMPDGMPVRVDAETEPFRNVVKLAEEHADSMHHWAMKGREEQGLHRDVVVQGRFVSRFWIEDE